MTDQPPPRRRPFQFRLRTLFILTAAVAMMLAGLSAPSDSVRFLSAASLVLAVPLVLTTILIYSGGYARTFCIGGLFPGGWGVIEAFFVADPSPHVSFFSDLLFLGQSQWYVGERATEVLGFLVIDLLLTIAGGLLAMGVRWLVESRNRADTE